MPGLSEELAYRVRNGWRVESVTGDAAVLVKGRRANHILHLLLTLVTCGLWLIPWFIIGIESGEKRIVVRQDPDGVARRVSGGIPNGLKVALGVGALFVVGSCVASMGGSNSTPTKAVVATGPAETAHFVKAPKKHVAKKDHRRAVVGD